MKVPEQMKKPLLFGLVVLLLALDWAALHDITKGEPNMAGEYTMLYFSIFAFAVIAFMWFKRKKVSNGSA